MEILDFTGDNFKVVKQFDGWKLGILRCGDKFKTRTYDERHFLTDEAFVLLEGKATLYENDTPYEMVNGKIYNIPKNIWHSIVVSDDATVLVIENSDTSPENSERRYL